MLKNKNLQFSIFTFCGAFLVLAFFYHEVLFNPNGYLFAPMGDGIQNYYTYLFHARYDNSFWEFSGMNYPFGEHVVYAGAQPGLSWLIGSLGLQQYGVGILNFLILISFPISAFFLFKIFSHYQLPNTLALFSAILIAFMSPQVFRMTGHLSLSPVFAIPMMWWLIILGNKTNRFIWSFAICFLILWSFFTHPYLGLILCFFVFFFLLVSFLADKKKWKSLLGKLVIQLIIPFVLFQVLIFYSDTHSDRIGTPAGFFEFYASWKSIFIAHHGPMSYLSIWLKINIGNWESWSYVGLTTAIFSMVILIYTIKNRKSIDFKKLMKNELVLFFIAAYFILLFAFCFPLKYHFLRGLADYFGPLKQFRVLGRFTWIFFYVFTVFSIIGYYRIVLKKEKKIGYLILLYVGLAFYMVEFYSVHKETARVVSTAPNAFDAQHLDADFNELIDFVKEEKMDAFIYLPFTHLSSENIMLLGTEKAGFESFILSYHTGKPMMNAVASRMSLSESILINNFFSPEFIEKEIVYLFNPGHKIMIIRNEEAITKNEQRLVWSSEKIFQNNTYKCYLFDADKWNTDYYYNLICEKEKNAIYNLESGWRSDTSDVWFYYVSFDEFSGESLGGTGALYSKKGGYDLILELNSSDLDTGLYTVNFWYYLGVDRADVTAVAEQVFKTDNPSFWYDSYAVSQSTFIVENWCFVTLDFEVTEDIEKINILITGNGNKQPFYVDEILVRKQNDRPLFHKKIKNGTNYLIYNNYWLKENSFQKKKIENR